MSGGYEVVAGKGKVKTGPSSWWPRVVKFGTHTYEVTAWTRRAIFLQ